MKKLLQITLLLLGLTITARAQTWGEWFNQKATQKKYLLEQIAALKIYASFLEKGYEVAKDGTQLIGDIKNGDFGLHKDYFNSKRKVNRAILDDEKPAAILDMHNAMLKQRQRMLVLISERRELSDGEIRMIRELLSGLAETSSKELDELMLVVEDGKVEMSDDERMGRINILYEKIQAAYSFQNRLNKDINALIAARKRQRQDMDHLRLLYGIGN